MPFYRASFARLRQNAAFRRLERGSTAYTVILRQFGVRADQCAALGYWVRQAPSGILWGDAGNFPFTKAIHRSYVSRQERRAVELLGSICDHERVLIYLQHGCLPVRGNLTGRTYLVWRRRRVSELRHGRVFVEWCIHLNKNVYPETDNVVTLKNMLEGEEGEFLKIANKVTQPEMLNGDIPSIPHIADL